mmetsp:Transcript_2890/g.5422  ORF Transcript_2890/g.5422 Transcript_2890/m.5422 type:complete len:274 (+) Transcript_2890:270-1091(+)
MPGAPRCGPPSLHAVLRGPGQPVPPPCARAASFTNISNLTSDLPLCALLAAASSASSRRWSIMASRNSWNVPRALIAGNCSRTHTPRRATSAQSTDPLSSKSISASAAWTSGASNGGGRPARKPSKKARLLTTSPRAAPSPARPHSSNFRRRAFISRCRRSWAVAAATTAAMSSRKSVPPARSYRSNSPLGVWYVSFLPFTRSSCSSTRIASTTTGFQSRRPNTSSSPARNIPGVVNVLMRVLRARPKRPGASKAPSPMAAAGSKNRSWARGP